MTPSIDNVAGLTTDEKRRRLGVELRRRLARGGATLPLSHGQRALWLLNRLAPESAALNVAFTARVVSPIDPSALRDAFQALIDRHPILRSTFPSEAGEPLQRSVDRCSVAFDHIDASGRSLDEIYADLQFEINRPFDLARGPILRVRLLTRSAGDSFLALTVHHIAMDGWSLWICLSELRDLYAAAARAATLDLPPPSADFRTYLQRQSDAVEGPEGLRHQNFWKARLGTGVSILDVPTDRIRPPTPAFRGASHRFRLSPEVTDRLRAITRGVRGTLQMGVVSLFEVLLHRYTGQHDVPIGYLASGRSHADLESVVGYVANPLVLRAAFRAQATFLEILRNTRDTLLDALEHEEYPFSLVVDQVAPNRDPSRSPLFQVLFVFEKPQLFDDQPIAAFIVGEPGARMTLGDLVLESLPFSMQREGQFELTLVAAEMDGALSLSLDYSTDLFDASTIKRMAEHLQTLAEGVVANPDSIVSDLPMLTAAERALIARLAAPSADVPGGCFHQMFEMHASERPAAPAVECGGSEATYGELNQRANRLARHLRELGVGPDMLVGLCIDRSLDLVVAVMAILKAGGGFLPLDPAYPEDRLAFMIADSQIPVLVTRRSLADRLPPFGGHVVVLEDLPAGGDGSNLALELSRDSLAYVIYTSGSTGRPKGVMLEHRGLVNVARQQQRLFGVGPASRVLQFASLSFDASVFEIAMALGSGGTLCLAAPAALLPGLPLLETIRDQRITVVTLPPSALLNLPAADLPLLETITVAGESCPGELVSRWAAGRSFFNLYGPTETTIWATVARCEDGGLTPPIGGPIANVQVHVLDAHFQHVPVGVPGELHIGGVGLARGYINQLELTASRFVPDLFSEEPGARLYKTGDLVRLKESGDLEFLGRVDDQVKLRGFRIELGEIEAVLSQHPGINEAAALVRGDTPDSQHIVAYVVARPSAGCSASALKGFLKARLPDFMVPASFVFMESFPLSPSGKVDRRALPAPAEGGSQDSRRTAPTGDLEESIAAIWREVLRVDAVGADDNFFDIGGTSLMIARVHARLNTIWPSALSIVQMFQFPTVRALAARLTAPENVSEADDSGRAQEMAAGRSRLRDLARRRSRDPETGTAE